MGEQNVEQVNDQEQMRAFMKALLDDVRALEAMLDSDLFDTGVRRIGAEQEMFLVDHACKPAAISEDVLREIDDERFTYELGRFNMEANLSPLVLGGDCLSRLEQETDEVVRLARAGAQKLDADVCLVGILPTLSRANLGLDSMVPIPRYYALNDALLKLRGQEFKFAIKGIDHLDVIHPNVMLEACNTSYQVHFQVAPSEFARLYNIAQAVTGPVMAAAVNSPILLGKRLWHETRIAVFEYSVDARSEAHQHRQLRPRVHFGDHWIQDSVVEIFKEDIARFRVILTTDPEDNPMEKIAEGKAPSFAALRLHNGTVYRWNRACYGVKDNIAHLRIENRVLPSGPTVLDEVANSAFFFGLMSGMSEEVGDITQRMNFDDARSNFFTAAREGLKAQQTWLDGKVSPAGTLILETMLPLAREGLRQVNIDESDIDRYLGVIEERVRASRTGARWLLDSYTDIQNEGKQDEVFRSLTSGLLERQYQGKPVHEWDLASFCPSQDWRESYRTVGQFMTTDLFTVRPDDLVDFAASLMEWKHLRHVPVEDDRGVLVGLVSHRALLRMVARGADGQGPVPVHKIMHDSPTTVTPEELTLKVIRIMRDEKLGCLPVVDHDGKLMGIVTERDLIEVSGRLLEDHLSEV